MYKNCDKPEYSIKIHAKLQFYFGASLGRSLRRYSECQSINMQLCTTDLQLNYSVATLLMEIFLPYIFGYLTIP